MSVQKINPVYQLNEKTNGSTLSSSEWNDISGAVNIAQTKINEIIDEGTGGGVVTVEVDPSNPDKRIIFTDGTLTGELTDKGTKGINVTVAGNNNINIEPRPAAGTGESKTPGDANRQGGNISLKPGDDIELWAHKRGSSKSDEVSVKIMTEVPKTSDPSKTDEVSAKLQLNTADIVITSKDKQEDSDETNITINKAANTRGYLKVRAQAIDLRSEAHGGIALQPRGNDGENHENKIKFEHGGGDGLEFATFNTEKTSVFTDEYRFNKAGVLKVATRVVVDNTPGQGGNDKYVDENIDPTTHYSYQKQADDFYDVISQEDPTCTWKDVVTTSSIFAKPANGVRIGIIGSDPMSRDLAILSTTVKVINDSEFDPEFDTLIDGLVLINPSMELPSEGTELTINELFDYFHGDNLEETICNTGGIVKLKGFAQAGSATVTKHLTVSTIHSTTTFMDIVALVNASANA